MLKKKTKIVCTIGPSSENEAVLKELIANGLNVCRLNFSHGSHPEHQAKIDLIKKVRKETDQPIAILLDTKGPEIRTGKFDAEEILLEEGQTFTLTTEDIIGNKEISSISYKGLVHDVKPGNTILIDDGLISMEVQKVTDKDIVCLVKNSGIIKNNKGINVPNVKINLPAITQKDKEDIIFGIENNIDFIAASFVRKASDVLAIREILEEYDAEHIQIISKIENQEGVDNIDDILQVTDAIMIARGDLGVEIPTEDIPIVQKMIIKKCNLLSKPVITATQMLDSMIRNPRPTRAEVTDVANAIYDGTDAIMLSGETASGKYPVEALKTMSRIASKTETTLDYSKMTSERAKNRSVNITNAISHATCTTADDIGASAIITATESGYTARMVSSYRPSQQIIGVVNDEVVLRQMGIVWGIVPLNIERRVDSTDELFDVSIDSATKEELIKSGDVVVITAGVPLRQTGSTNLIKVHVVTEILAKGIGIGNHALMGCARKDLSNFIDGDILIAKFTDRETVPYMERASAIIVEEGGLTNHAAVVGLSLGKPVIVGAKNILETIRDGEDITIEPNKGYVYRGKVSVL
ncbi:pyruvate kinase [Filifactor villosus]|uniref:Pyruvate kinase n=1 Tax=Filifactor villosus TaxID=29374 RepID=A0ABV9QIZ0_9FIRM